MTRVLPLVLMLAGCQAASGTPAEAAKACARVHAGADKVSANKARAVVAVCKLELDRWALSSIERRYGKSLQTSDPKMMAEYRDTRRALDEMFLLELSDEIKLTHYRL